MAEAGAVHSRWTERDSTGRQLLREQGTLGLAAAAVEQHCSAGRWTLRLEQRQGARDYQGRSSNGAPLATHSQVREQRWQLRWTTPLEAMGPGFEAGAEGWHEEVQRNIASAGLALGYPERHRQDQLALGLRYGHAPGGSPWRAQAELWAGAGPAGRMQLQLPNTDPATLRLGSSRRAQLRLALGRDSGRGDWSWQGAVQLEQLRTGAGPAQALTRNGVVVGGAAQPATRRHALAAVLALTRRFE